MYATPTGAMIKHLSVREATIYMNKETIESLKELDLTEYEAKVYLALISLGKSGSYKLAAESEISYGKIYTVLASLERKHLVKVIPEKTKKFIPTNPENLIHAINKKEQRLNAIRNQVKELKQVYDKTDKEPVNIIQGKKNFYKTRDNEPEPKKSIYTIRFNTEKNEQYKEYFSATKKKGIETKHLVRYNKETKKNVLWWKKFAPHTRAMNNEGVAGVVIDETYMYISLINANTIIEINDKAFVKFFKELIDKAYPNCEEIR